MGESETRQDVQTYRFNYLDMRNHLKSFDETELGSDMLACERARALYNCEPLEVWRGSRFVCRVEADGEFIEGQIVISRTASHLTMLTQPTVPTTPVTPATLPPPSSTPPQPTTPKPKH